MALKAGTIDDFDDSMAEAIQYAMQQEWIREMGTGQAFVTNKQLQLICVAVAQGVVAYLSQHAADSLSVHVTYHHGTYPHHHGTFPVHIATTGTLYQD